MSNPPRQLPHGYGSTAVTLNEPGIAKVQARWMEDGHRRSRTFTRPTLAEAHDAAVDHLLQIHRTRRDGKSVPPALMTVSDVVDTYIERAGDRLTGRTVRTYQERARSMIMPYLGERKARDLETLDVQRWIDRLGKETIMVKGERVRRFAASSIHPAIAVMQGAFREAHSLGILPRNVVQGVRRPTIERHVIEVWTAEQVRAVLTATRGDAIYEALYRVALATGMRPGELRALRWKHVDLERGIVHVRATISREDDTGAEEIVERTKRGKFRAVAISSAVVTSLKRHKVKQNERRLLSSEWKDYGLVFDRGDGHWLYQSGWQRYHQAMCERAGVPYISHHELRHTSASLELEAGTHPKVVADRLGHSSIEITLDLYSHTSADLQRAAAESLSARLFDDEDDDNSGGNTGES